MSKYLVRLASTAILTLGLTAVAQPQEFNPDEILTQPVRTIEDPELITFSTDVQLVSVPVVVQGKNDQYVNGLEKTDFLLFDNNTQQEIIEFDVSFQPISMVICVQSSDRLADDMLDQVRKTAYLFTQQVLGEFGEAAVIGFDSRVKIISDFSSDTKEINKALKAPAVTKGIAARGGTPVGGTPEEFAQHVRRQMDNMSKLLKGLEIKPQ